jgi:predicted dinucleotide-binding enzyme
MGAGTPQQAAAFGEVLVFAVPYGALPELGWSLRDSIKGKVVIDACNPFPRRDGEIAERARERGAGLMSAELLSGAHIVRAFNAIGADRMGEAHQEPGRVGMPIAGDDEEALEVASRLIREIGYEPVRIGGLAIGKYLMPGTPLAGEHSPGEIRAILRVRQDHLAVLDRIALAAEHAADDCADRDARNALLVLDRRLLQ